MKGVYEILYFDGRGQNRKFLLVGKYTPENLFHFQQPLATDRYS